MLSACGEMGMARPSRVLVYSSRSRIMAFIFAEPRVTRRAVLSAAPSGSTPGLRERATSSE